MLTLLHRELLMSQTWGEVEASGNQEPLCDPSSASIEPLCPQTSSEAPKPSLSSGPRVAISLLAGGHLARGVEALSAGTCPSRSLSPPLSYGGATGGAVTSLQVQDTWSSWVSPAKTCVEKGTVFGSTLLLLTLRLNGGTSWHPAWRAGG